MFFGYCLDPTNGYWTPREALPTARDAYQYCLRHHHWSPDVRVTDAGDFLVLHVDHHILKCPKPDGTLREVDLRTPVLPEEPTLTEIDTFLDTVPDEDLSQAEIDQVVERVRHAQAEEPR